MDLIFLLVAVFSFSFSIYYMFKTRSYRRQGKQDLMRFYNAKTNIAMGIMLIALGIIQFFILMIDPSTWRIIVGIIFIALGGFNLYMGIRHYRTYLPKVSNSDPNS